MDYSKPIFFRPSTKDVELLELIAKNHPLSEESPTELLRKALEAYWFEHAPGIGRSKGARIDRLEEKMDHIETTLSEHGDLLRLLCDKLSVEVIDHVP